MALLDGKYSFPLFIQTQKTEKLHQKVKLLQSKIMDTFLHVSPLFNIFHRKNDSVEAIKRRRWG